MTWLIMREQDGFKHWVRIISPMCDCELTARVPTPPDEYYYADRAEAERDAEIFRQKNAKAVEATKRARKYKTKPATFSIVQSDPAPDEAA